MLTDVYNCFYKTTESLSNFANGFKGCVAKNAVQSGSIEDHVSVQMAVIMLKSSCLTDDTLSSLSLRLTSVTKPKEDTCIKVSLNKFLFTYLLNIAENYADT